MTSFPSRRTPVDFHRARKIQDLLCESERVGYSYDEEIKETFFGSVRNRIFSSPSPNENDSDPQEALSQEKYTDVIDIDIVIPVFGLSPTLSPCITAIAASRGVTPHVIIIDNGADAAALADVKGESCVENIISNSENRGFGGGCDQGISASQSECVVLLNSDAIVQRDTLRKIIDVLANNPEIAISAATCLHPDGSIQEAGRVLNNEAHSFGILRDTSIADAQSTEIVSVPFASFVCVALRKKTYDAVGGFDADFAPAYSEDVDLCIRLWDSGFATVVRRDAYVHHGLGESSAQLSELDNLKERNRKILLNKHLSFFDALPTLDDPTRYPHEISLARSVPLSLRTLVVCDETAPLDDILSAASVKAPEIVSSCVGVIFLHKDIDIDQLHKSDDRWKMIDIFDSRHLALHHWLRERIELFENVVIIGDPEHRKSGEVIALLQVTQPNATFNFIDQSESTS